MAQSASTMVPAIDGELCVHGVSAVATCDRCVRACPAQALHLTQSALSIDEAACTGCGHCLPACTQAAISFPASSPAPLIDTHAREGLIACSQAMAGQGEGVVECLHAVGERDLHKLAGEGIRALLLARAACASCVHKPAVPLEARAAAVNRIRRSQGKAVIELREADAQEWQRRHSDVRAAGHQLDHSRRGLFAGLLRRQKPAMPSTGSAAVDPLARYVPQINSGACVACHACAGICPQHAIVLARHHDRLEYAFNASACTGCGLCVDVCADAAVTIVEFAPARTPPVALTEARCSRCGVSFHSVEGNAPASVAHASGASGSQSICRICASKPHAAKLFEVRR